MVTMSEFCNYFVKPNRKRHILGTMNQLVAVVILLHFDYIPSGFSDHIVLFTLRSRVLRRIPSGKPLHVKYFKFTIPYQKKRKILFHVIVFYKGLLNCTCVEFRA